MNLRALAAVMLGGLAVSSCINTGAPTKADASQAELEPDQRECRALALRAAPQHFDAQTQQWEPDAYTITRDYRQCMQARGWHFTPGILMP